MHRTVAVIIPDQVDDIEEYIERQMRPHDVDYATPVIGHSGKWDGYVIGGRYSGWLHGRPAEDGQAGGHMAVNEPELWKDRTPRAILTPEGRWFDPSPMHWRPVTPVEEWYHEARLVLARYWGLRIVIVDAHI